MADDVVEKTEEVTEKVESEDRDETQKTYTRDEYRKILSEKKEAKAKADQLAKELASIREAEEKAKNEKAIADGKAKDLLAEREKELATAKERLKAYEKQEQELRDDLLGQIKDKEIKAIGEKLDLADLRKLVEKSTGQSPFSDKTKTGGPDPKKVFDPSQYKDIREFEAALKAQGLA